MPAGAAPGQLMSKTISECLSGNKTLTIAVGWRPTHVTYSWMKGTNDGSNDDVTASNLMSNYAGNDSYGDNDVHICQLLVMPAALPIYYLHVKFVYQTCTQQNQVVLRGHTQDARSNVWKE